MSKKRVHKHPTPAELAARRQAEAEKRLKYMSEHPVQADSSGLSQLTSSKFRKDYADRLLRKPQPISILDP